MPDFFQRETLGTLGSHVARTLGRYPFHHTGRTRSPGALARQKGGNPQKQATPDRFFFFAGARCLSAGHHLRLTRRRAGNRTTSGSVSASPRTTPYQLSRGDTFQAKLTIELQPFHDKIAKILYLVAVELWLRRDEVNIQRTLEGVARSLTLRLPEHLACYVSRLLRHQTVDVFVQCSLRRFPEEVLRWLVSCPPYSSRFLPRMLFVLK